MTSTPVDPVTVLTRGGYYAVISSLAPESEDCLEGYLLIPGDEPKVFNAEWNRDGLCRDQSEGANLIISRSDALQKLVDAIDGCSD